MLSDKTELLVVETAHVQDHVLNIVFNNGHSVIVDFAPFIFSNGHPNYEPYKNIDVFLSYKLEDGNLNWDDYTMIFPVENLYANSLLKNF